MPLSGHDVVKCLDAMTDPGARAVLPKAPAGSTHVAVTAVDPFKRDCRSHSVVSEGCGRGNGLASRRIKSDGPVTYVGERLRESVSRGEPVAASAIRMRHVIAYRVSGPNVTAHRRFTRRGSSVRVKPIVRLPLPIQSLVDLLRDLVELREVSSLWFGSLLKLLQIKRLQLTCC